MAFSIFNSCLQKKPYRQVEKSADIIGLDDVSASECNVLKASNLAVALLAGKAVYLGVFVCANCERDKDELRRKDLSIFSESHLSLKNIFPLFWRVCEMF